MHDDRPNATGKTAVCQALLRLFSVVRDQRQIRVGDFHVPEDEEEAPEGRTLTIEAIFAFPELDEDNADTSNVPEFFAQMSADDGGQLKLRIVLEATWSPEGSVDGTIEEHRRVVHTFKDDYGDQWVELRASDRNRIQMVYVPATRDGARQVDAFLRGRIWRASQWSDQFRTHLGDAADELSDKFKAESVVESVTNAISSRWQELHHVASERNPYFEPINRDVSVLVTKSVASTLLAHPGTVGTARRALLLRAGHAPLEPHRATVPGRTASRSRATPANGWAAAKRAFRRAPRPSLARHRP